jgi:hypothetical protein
MWTHEVPITVCKDKYLANAFPIYVLEQRNALSLQPFKCSRIFFQ